MMSSLKVCVFLPAYNESKSVEMVINEVRRYLPEAEIVVIDDGSRDKTAEVAAAAGAVVLKLPFNLGIGGAVQTGLRFAYRQGFAVALEIDADGQHQARFAPSLIEALREADLVIGSRFIKDSAYRSSIMRRFGIHTFSWLIRLVTGVRIYDSTSGFRAYGPRALSYLAESYPADFPEPESIVLLLRRGYKIKEVSVEMSKRLTGESIVGKSDLSWKAAYFVLSNAIAIVFLGLKLKFFHDKP
jgi:glycosyltransferase involved in cell wall biosynthesis